MRISLKVIKRLHCNIYGRPHLGSFLMTLCTSGFVDDVSFCHIIERIRQNQTTRMFGRVRHLAAREAKSAISDRISFDL